MSWLRRANRPKHPKDTKQIFLWHISPERLTNLSPRSRLGSLNIPVQSGLYFSPSYNSLIQDWMPYVLGKKRKTHDIDRMWRETWDKIDDLEKLPDSPEKEVESEKLHQKIDKLRETMNRDSHYENSTIYKTAFITKVICPEWVMKASYDFMHNVYNDQEERGVASIGFWGWGAQIFIPADYLKYLTIVGSKRYEPNDLLDVGKRKPRGYNDPVYDNWRPQ